MDISKYLITAQSESRPLTPEEQLIDAMVSAGIDPPDVVHIDGHLHRFAGESGRKSLDAWYVVYSDGIPAGRFGCWRRDISATFLADTGRAMTPGDEMAYRRRIADAKAARDAEAKKRAEVAADVCDEIWSRAAEATPDHPYLLRKQVKPHGLRVTGDGRLIAPMYNADGEMVSLQYIAADGDKKFHGGGAVAGAYWKIGPGEQVYLCEGVATAATIFEATGRCVAIAFNAGNLAAVAKSITESTGKAPVIVADKDASGAGERAAYKAAEITGARVIVSPVDSDVNDYAVSGGDVLALLEPPESWLVPADDMTSQPAPIKWLVKHWLQSEAMMMIHGPSGAGKTFVVLDMAASISSGAADWRGHKVTPGPVVYLAGEGHHGLRGRLAAWRQHHGGVSLGKMWLSKGGCELNTPRGYMHTVEQIRMLPDRPCLIIVDTLHRFLDGDENSAQDAKTMLDACDGLMREFSASVLLVHHTGVSDEAQHRARGSSAWRGALDIEISIFPGKSGTSSKIEQKKAKDSEQAQPIFFDLQPVEIVGWRDDDGEPVTSAICVEGVESAAPAKIDRKLSDAIKTIEAAWWASGCEVMADSPYISRSALREKLLESRKTAKTIEAEIDPHQDKTIGILIANGIVSPVDHGWIIIELELASSLMLRSSGLRENDAI